MNFIFLDDTDEQAFNFLLDRVEDNYLLSKIDYSKLFPSCMFSLKLNLCQNLELIYNIDITVVRSLDEISKKIQHNSVLVTKIDSLMNNINYIKPNMFCKLIIFGEVLKNHHIEVLKKSNIDYKTFRRRSHQMVAEHVFTMLLMHYRKMDSRKIKNFIAPANIPQRRYLFNWMEIQNIKGLYGKNIGIIGMGEIGIKVARIANSFGMKVLYTQREANNIIPDAMFVDKGQLLLNSDVVTLHLPLNNSTLNYFNKKDFELLKHEAVLINTSRARLIDKVALEQWIESDKCGGFLSDVYAKEPINKKELVGSNGKVLYTPHIAGLPVESQIEDIIKIITGTLCKGVQ